MCKMILNTRRCLTSNFKNLLYQKESLEIFKSKTIFCTFGTSKVLYERRKKKGWCWKKEKNEFKVIKSENCVKSSKPILEPFCKIGMIIGGAKGFGYVAADELLSRGARRVIILDKNKDRGDRAVQRLCDAYGKDRASFVECDIRHSALLKVAFEEVICRHKAIHILFSDLDENQTLLNTSVSGTNNDNWSNTRKTSMIGLKYMGTKNGGPGGIIVNCASILGFMDWPQNPSPVYCKKEPVIEVTRSIAEENPVEKSGIRFVAICPTNKPFEKISLPDFPRIQSQNECSVECIPSKKIAVGLALTHVIAWAQSGSTWLVPPFPSLYELPKLIHFPKSHGEITEPETHKNKHCPVALEPHCAKILEETSTVNSNANYTLIGPKKKV